MDKWLWASAADLGRGIGSGEIDPIALTDTYLAAIDAHPMRDRIYARVTHDRARAEARAAAARAHSGHRLSLLDGVPVSWKDNFDTAGIGTEAGTALLKGRVPDKDAAVLQAATAMGLVCLGKTHMTEIAFSGLGYNPITATPPCKNDPLAVPGGSSSGAAASVAFGLAAAAVGTDTGGSVRVPSVWNDLVGLKTTHGLLSLQGVIPLCKTFDSVGPLCRTVEDAALMLGALQGRSAADLSGATVSGARFLIFDTLAMTDLRDAPRAAFDVTCAKLKQAGATLTHGTFDPLFRAFDLAAMLFSADSYAYWRPLVEANPDVMYHQIRTRIRGGKDWLATDYIAGWAELQDIRNTYAAEMAGYDAVIMPTSAIMAPTLTRLIEDDAYFVTENLLALRNTRIANLLGLCSMTLPTGVPGTGVMMNGPAGQDARLLRLAAAAEQVLA